ncbi:hypothetical protein [Actinoallomurus sp. CA-142502]|uniref:Uncharacterized protein n=1 Tax=Actinoallomurus iriomotensis TaxID=478107 RepID=A0A9W6RKP9_9ACTN|nr:hypothetical protein Airi01_057250 [Actinoallomurus iriomotensis]
MGDQAPRSRRSGESGSERDRAGRRGPRRCRIILFVLGGLLGPGYWLCGSVWGGRLVGRSPAEGRFTEFVLAMVVVVVASWGLLLILGEALLFALAVVRADDRERYDIYRNLMILWGYVLTLGIPRHFRKLPAQFGTLPDDARPRTGGRPPARGDARTGRTVNVHHDRTERGQQTRETAPRPRTRTGAEDRTREGARDRSATPERTDVRDDRTERGEQIREAAPRRRTRSGTTAPRPRTSGGTEDRDSSAAPGARKRAASLGAVAREGAPPLGPIFPPRPAAEAETTPVSGPASGPVAASAPVPVAAGPAAEARPGTELRDALDLLMRYAARFGIGEPGTPEPAPPDPGTPFGVVAEAGGDT